VSQPYAIKVWAGSYSWTVLSTDPAGYGLADPLTITESLPDTDLFPMVQPSPATASFRIVVANVASLANLQLGDPVTIRYFKGATPAAGDIPVVDFCGRVAQLNCEPHDLGAVYTVTCVDYLADLAEPQVGAVAWPQETLDARVRRILTEAGVSIPADLWFTDFDPSPQPTITARAAGASNAWDLLVHTLDQYRAVFVGFPQSTGRAFIQQTTTPANPTWASGASSLDMTLGPFQLNDKVRSPSYQPPLRVVNFFGTHLLTGDNANTDYPSVIIDTSYVEKAVTFTQRKGTGVNAVSVASDSFGVQTATWGLDPKVWANVDTELLNSADGASLAALYLSPGQPSGKALWVADQFVWRIARDPSTNWLLPILGRLVTLYDIALKWGVGGQQWWSGTCMAWTFQVAGGEAQAAITVAPWNVDPTQALSPLALNDPGWDGPVSRTNLSQAPGMEGQHGWIGNAGATVTIDATQFWTGTRSLKVVTTVENWGYFPLDGLVAGGVTHPGHVAGQVFSASVMVFSPTAQTLCLTDYGSANVQGPSVAVPANTWTRLTLPGWTTGANVFLSVRNPNRVTNVATIYLDGWQIEQTATLGTYFDGDTPPDGANAHAWTGTAGNSTSTERTGISIDSLMSRDTFDDYRLAKGPAQ
jgi:hypothetical protein